MLTILTFNLSNSPIRRETLHGRQYIVAPMAMLTEGVHNGSGGPLLYREDECKRAVPAWNMKPVVVYHPEINGQGVSACDPDILERQQVGMVLNTRWDGKLRSEAWVDEERAKLVDARVIEALEENKMMEVSTGLFTDNLPERGEWNGEEYTAIATNHQPDHLALLPDKIGACSIADGAGLLQLNEAVQARGLDMTRIFAREMDVLRRMVGNAMSHSNVYAAISRALREKIKGDDVWVADVYDNFFIYDMEKDKKLYRLNYTSGDAGVELIGEPEEVLRVTEYRTTQGDFVGNVARHDNKEKGMNKKELVASLIANVNTQWGEDDREALMAMEEGVLAKMAPVEGSGDEGPEKKHEEGEEPVQKPAPVTMEAYVGAAPAELRDVLTNALATHNQAKDEMINKILANKANKFSKEFLAAKGLAELQGLAALATAGETKPNNVPMFQGAATLDGMPVNNEEPEEVLLPPTMNFDAAKA